VGVKITIRLLLGNSHIKIFAKIENKKGLNNFDSILKIADGVVIDRGYLGAEIDLDIVVVAQKKMICSANKFGKPIYIANQILESMVTNNRPTRSEAAGKKIINLRCCQFCYGWC
jgi:pyruvate kinase